MSGINKKRWLSPTAINTYLRCPRKFFLRYIKKLKIQTKHSSISRHGRARSPG